MSIGTAFTPQPGGETPVFKPDTKVSVRMHLHGEVIGRVTHVWWDTFFGEFAYQVRVTGTKNASYPRGTTITSDAGHMSKRG